MFGEEEPTSESIAIETRNLSKRYPNGVLAVDDLSLQVQKGEVFGFLGPNGAGKTTSIKMMVGLLKPTSGQVLIEGEGIEAASKSIKKRIGVCPQDIVVWTRLTCMENLLVMADMYEVPRDIKVKRAEKLLDDLKLTEKKDTLAAALSGGMKRRLNVAMALIHDPEIVVLDEPTAGLDPQSRLVVTEYIRELKGTGKKTVILTTHIMEIADQLSDRVAIIDHGKLLVLETPENLKDRIGKGDIMEIALYDEAKNKMVREVIEGIDGVQEVNEIGGKIVVRALDAASKFPEIFTSLKSMGADVLDVSLRRNSLEDVFITLTGRGLRE
ncbi:Linearmycin resistance ATP-binding protein LnrL [subsurface metagenome]